jgi:hypothetical protein
VLGQQPGVSNTGESQRTPEGATPLCQREAGRIRMQMRSPTRQSAARIGLEPEISPHRGAGTSFGHDEPDQLRGRRAFATTDTGAYRADH